MEPAVVGRSSADGPGWAEKGVRPCVRFALLPRREVAADGRREPKREDQPWPPRAGERRGEAVVWFWFAAARAAAERRGWTVAWESERLRWGLSSSSSEEEEVELAYEEKGLVEGWL